MDKFYHGILARVNPFSDDVDDAATDLFSRQTRR